MLTEWLESFAAAEFKTRIDDTMKDYTCHCRAFIAWLETLGAEPVFTTIRVRAFVALLGDDRRPRTVRKYLASLRAWGEWCVANEKLSENPAINVRAPKLDKPRREVPTSGQVAELLRACSLIDPPYREALARAVVATLAFSAVRRSELLALKLSDIDFDRGLLEVRHGKGNLARSLNAGQPCFEALSAYLLVRPDCDEDHVFLVRKGVAMANDGLRSLLRQVMKAAGMPDCKALRPHGLRHECASRMHINGVDTKHLMMFLGHSHMATTEIYLHTDEERMRTIGTFTALPNLPAPPIPPAPAQPPTKSPALRLVDDTKQRPAG